jgi:hypothetical protein
LEASAPVSPITPRPSIELPPPPGMHCLAAQLQAWLTASRDKTNESSRVAPETTLDPNMVDPGLIGLSSTPRACKCSPRRPLHFPTGTGVYHPQLAVWAREAGHFRWMVLPGEALRTHASDGLAHIFAALSVTNKELKTYAEKIGRASPVSLGGPSQQ